MHDFAGQPAESLPLRRRLAGFFVIFRDFWGELSCRIWRSGGMIISQFNEIGWAGVNIQGYSLRPDKSCGTVCGRLVLRRLSARDVARLPLKIMKKRVSKVLIKI